MGSVQPAQIPTSFGHELRACLRCRLVKTYDQNLCEDEQCNTYHPNVYEFDQKKRRCMRVLLSDQNKAVENYVEANTLV